MSPKATLLCLVLLFLVSSSTPSASVNTNMTVYEALKEYDFPVGILPKGVLSYELDKFTGIFSVHLNTTCTFSIDSYKVRYKSTITGVIREDKIAFLTGVQVKVLFLWLGIFSVERDDDELEFTVGTASEDYPVSNFVESPTCGCGFNCVNGAGSKIKHNHLVSSA